MALEKMETLEGRIRNLVALVQELKTRNAHLEEEIQLAKKRLLQQAELYRAWEQERTDIRLRIEKVLGELEVFESLDEQRVPKEVALD